jgi:uncharacterized membrane protein YkoI
MYRVFPSLLLVPWIIFAPLQARADDETGVERDHDQAEEAYEGSRSGKFLALADVIVKASALIEGEIVKAKFEQLDGIPVYEIFFLDADGHRRELYLDARTALPMDRAGDEDE